MKGKMNAKMGNIIIDRDVLAKYAGAATAECIGIVGMAAVNVKDGVIKLLKKENAGRGVNVYVVDSSYCCVIQPLKLAAVAAVLSIGKEDPISFTDQNLIIIVHVFNDAHHTAIIKLDF